jgi:hypothetical protein
MPLVWSPGLTVQAHGLLNHSSALLDSLTIGAHASRHAEGGVDTVFPWNHASRHASGGADALSDLSRSMLTDFFVSPFWDNIPDKPSSYPPSAHASSHASGGADALPSGSVAPAMLSFQTLKKVAELSVSSDTTQIDVTGLNLSTDKLYWFAFAVKNPTASTTNYYIAFNGDTTTANYYAERVWFEGTGYGAARANYPDICDNIGAGKGAVFHCLVFRDVDGYPRYIMDAAHWGVSDIGRKILGGIWNSTANVTSISLWSSVASGIGAGSRLIMYGGTG